MYVDFVTRNLDLTNLSMLNSRFVSRIQRYDLDFWLFYSKKTQDNKAIL